MYSFLLSTRTFVGIAVAFLISWLLVRARIPAFSFIEFSLWMAWFLPPLSVTIGWIALLDPQYGLVNELLASMLPFPAELNIYSFSGIFWVHLTLLTVPVMTILLTPALRQMDASFEESARTCGSGPLGTLTRIVLPLLWPAILVVTIASLIRSLEAFEVEQIIGIPAGIYVYGTRIYDLVRWDPPLYSQAMALSTVFLLALFVLVILYQRFTRHREFATLGPRGVSFRPALIGRWRYRCFRLFDSMDCRQHLSSARDGIGRFVHEVLRYVRHRQSVYDPTLDLGAQRSRLCQGVAELVDPRIGRSDLGSCGLRASRIHNPAQRSCWPFDVEFTRLDSMGDSRNSARLVLAVDLSLRAGIQFLYGTMLVLIFSVVLKDMPIGTQMFKAAFAQVTEELEEASSVAGAGPFTTFRRITIPLVAPMMVSIFVLVFMSSIRDISTPILLATPSTTPLSVLMLERSVAGEIEKAAVIGVILSVLAIITAMVMRRLGFRMGAEPI